MQERYYLTREESLRLKRQLERLHAILFHDKSSALALHIQRKGLKDIVDSLALASKTREILKGLLEATENYPLEDSKKETAGRLLNELKSLYRLDQLELKTR